MLCALLCQNFIKDCEFTIIGTHWGVCVCNPDSRPLLPASKSFSSSLFGGQEAWSPTCPESISCRSCFSLPWLVSRGPSFTLLLVAARTPGLLPLERMLLPTVDVIGSARLWDWHIYCPDFFSFPTLPVHNVVLAN